MKVSIAGIWDRGIHDKERIHLRADVALNLSFYVLLDTSEIGLNQISAGSLNAYWFPPKDLNRGDNVVVYSRGGSASSETRVDGSVWHFIFRGSQIPLDDVTFVIIKFS